MTGDLLVIVPSRGRPGSVARLLDRVHATARLATHVHVAVDDDDPDLGRYREVMAEHGGDGDTFEHGPRDGLVGWTNEIAVRRAAEYPFLASLGDDMVPRTPGWDRALCRAITEQGGTGISYPWDGTREDIPEAPVVSSGIVAALGWMFLPGLGHWFPDNVLADLGRAIGCLRYLRAVAVDHVHAATGQAPADATYADAAGEGGSKIAADEKTYRAWRADPDGMAADVAKLLALREKALQAA